MTTSTAAFEVPEHHDRIRVYVWDLVVRITHWLMFFSTLVLVPTGLYIAHPFRVSGVLLMGYAHMVHLWAAAVLAIVVLARTLWLVVGSRYASWDEFLPFSKRRITDVVKTVLFYGLVFRKPPVAVGHNPLAGLSYFAMGFVYVGIIGTGLAMYGSSDLTGIAQYFRFLVPFFGGLQMARWIHHLLMWVVILFSISHIYTATVTSTLERNGELDSMFSGNKFFTAKELAEADDRREKKQ